MAHARHFRFRTGTLIGPWRMSRKAALDDAVEAKQATRDGAGNGDVLWQVPGEIEERRP